LNVKAQGGYVAFCAMWIASLTADQRALLASDTHNAPLSSLAGAPPQAQLQLAARRFFTTPMVDALMRIDAESVANCLDTVSLQSFSSSSSSLSSASRQQPLSLNNEKHYTSVAIARIAQRALLRRGVLTTPSAVARLDDRAVGVDLLRSLARDNLLLSPPSSTSLATSAAHNLALLSTHLPSNAVAIDSQLHRLAFELTDSSAFLLRYACAYNLLPSSSSQRNNGASSASLVVVTLAALLQNWRVEHLSRLAAVVGSRETHDDSSLAADASDSTTAHVQSIESLLSRGLTFTALCAAADQVSSKRVVAALASVSKTYTGIGEAIETTEKSVSPSLDQLLASKLPSSTSISTSDDQVARRRLPASVFADAPDVMLRLDDASVGAACHTLLLQSVGASSLSASSGCSPDCVQRYVAASVRYAAIVGACSGRPTAAAAALALASTWQTGDDTKLLIDVAAAHRIVTYASNVSPASLAHLFLQFGASAGVYADIGNDAASSRATESSTSTNNNNNENEARAAPRTAVQRALTLLEDATLALTLDVDATAKRKQRGAGSAWSLVTAFCHTHGLPLSTGHLCELAQANDWVGLLYEAQTQHFPAWQVRHIIKRHIAAPALRSHMLIALRDKTIDNDDDDDDDDDDDIEADDEENVNDLQESEDGEEEDDDSDDDDDDDDDSLEQDDQLDEEHDVLDALFDAGRHDEPRRGEALLAGALRCSSAVLSVVAACCSDARVVDALVVSLFAARGALLAPNFERVVVPSPTAQLEKCLTILLTHDNETAAPAVRVKQN